MSQIPLYQWCAICGRLVNSYQSAPRRYGHDACSKAFSNWNWEAENTEDTTAGVTNVTPAEPRAEIK